MLFFDLSDPSGDNWSTDLFFETGACGAMLGPGPGCLITFSTFYHQIATSTSRVCVVAIEIRRGFAIFGRSLFPLYFALSFRRLRQFKITLYAKTIYVMIICSHLHRFGCTQKYLFRIRMRVHGWGTRDEGARIDFSVKCDRYSYRWGCTGVEAARSVFDYTQSDAQSVRIAVFKK